MDLIYLDIDGVMVPAGHYHHVIPDLIAARLRTILNSTHARIVVSSARRRTNEVRGLLHTAGFSARDLAPDWRTRLSIPDFDFDLSIRGQEIADHVQTNRPGRYVILDDCPVLSDQAAHHVQPDEKIGLTDAHVDQAIAILKAPANFNAFTEKPRKAA